MHRLVLVVSRVTNADRLDTWPRIAEKVADHKVLRNDTITQSLMLFQFVNKYCMLVFHLESGSRSPTHSHIQHNVNLISQD